MLKEPGRRQKDKRVGKTPATNLHTQRRRQEKKKKTAESAVENFNCKMLNVAFWFRA